MILKDTFRCDVQISYESDGTPGEVNRLRWEINDLLKFISRFNATMAMEDGHQKQSLLSRLNGHVEQKLAEVLLHEESAKRVKEAGGY